MKGKILLLVLTILFAIPSFAQKSADKKGEDKRKEMMEFKLKFLGDEMDLREDQRKQFNELYSQMEQERRTTFKKIKEVEKKILSNKNASEAEYDKATKEIAEAKSQMTQIEKKYDEKFATFLTKKQIFKMKEAEGKFMDKMRDCRDKKKGSKKK